MRAASGSTAMRQCDVAVIGGGAGSTMASLLAFKGLCPLTALARLPANLQAWRRRHANIRGTDTANADA